MGFESFRVELVGDTPAARVREAVRALPGVEPDPDGGLLPGDYFRVRDGRHVIELHLSDVGQRLSVRFSLANPASVDAAFLDVARHLMTHAGLRVRVLTDVATEFTLAEFDQFAAVVAEETARERRGSVDMFGPDTFAAGTAEVFRRVILPRCEPAVGRRL